MAKKTRCILCMSDSFENRLYDLCDELDIHDKDVTSFKNEDARGGYFIHIYCGKKKFDHIAFKLGLGKVDYYI